MAWNDWHPVDVNTYGIRLRGSLMSFRECRRLAPRAEKQ